MCWRRWHKAEESDQGEKCIIAETCAEVQGIWAFVEPVWIPTHPLSISDEQQDITEQGMTVKHGLQRYECGGAKSYGKSKLRSLNCPWSSGSTGQCL